MSEAKGRTRQGAINMSREVAEELRTSKTTFRDLALSADRLLMDYLKAIKDGQAGAESTLAGVRSWLTNESVARFTASVSRSRGVDPDRKNVKTAITDGKSLAQAVQQFGAASIAKGVDANLTAGIGRLYAIHPRFLQFLSSGDVKTPAGGIAKKTQWDRILDEFLILTGSVDNAASNAALRARYNNNDNLYPYVRHRDRAALRPEIQNALSTLISDLHPELKSNPMGFLNFISESSKKKSEKKQGRVDPTKSRRNSTKPRLPDTPQDFSFVKLRNLISLFEVRPGTTQLVHQFNPQLQRLVGESPKLAQFNLSPEQKWAYIQADAQETQNYRDLVRRVFNRGASEEDFEKAKKALIKENLIQDTRTQRPTAGSDFTEMPIFNGLGIVGYKTFRSVATGTQRGSQRSPSQRSAGAASESKRA